MFAVAAWSQAPETLRVRIVDGDGGFNDIRNQIGHTITVEIRDQNNAPVAGAEVTLTAPEFGPSGTFENGTRTEVLTTDPAGRVHSRGIKPNDIEGRLIISVVARLQGLEGTAKIGQGNTAATVPMSSSQKKKAQKKEK